MAAPRAKVVRSATDRDAEPIEPTAPLSPSVPATPQSYWRLGLLAMAILILGLILMSLA